MPKAGSFQRLPCQAHAFPSTRGSQETSILADYPLVPLKPDFLSSLELIQKTGNHNKLHPIVVPATTHGTGTFEAWAIWSLLRTYKGYTATLAQSLAPFPVLSSRSCIVSLHDWSVVANFQRSKDRNRRPLNLAHCRQQSSTRSTNIEPSFGIEPPTRKGFALAAAILQQA